MGVFLTIIYMIIKAIVLIVVWFCCRYVYVMFFKPKVLPLFIRFWGWCKPKVLALLIRFWARCKILSRGFPYRVSIYFYYALQEFYILFHLAVYSWWVWQLDSKMVYVITPIFLFSLGFYALKDQVMLYPYLVYSMLLVFIVDSVLLWQSSKPFFFLILLFGLIRSAHFPSLGAAEFPPEIYDIDTLVYRRNEPKWDEFKRNLQIDKLLCLQELKENIAFFVSCVLWLWRLCKELWRKFKGWCKELWRKFKGWCKELWLKLKGWCKESRLWLWFKETWFKELFDVLWLLFKVWWVFEVVELLNFFPLFLKHLWVDVVKEELWLKLKGWCKELWLKFKGWCKELWLKFKGWW